MAVSNGGMTLYTNNNTQETWSGSDDLDLEVSKDGGGSESWLVAKNGNETTAISLTVNLGTPKYFNFWMKSDWGAFYIEITASLLDGTNTNLFTVATGGKNAIPNLSPEISGDFKPSVMQISEGSAGGTYVPANHTSVSINVDASTSGNIRSITNHWIDGMWYGTGRTISGTPIAGNVFLESHELDVSTTNYDGCSVLTDAGLAFYTDVTDATASISENASVVFNAKSTTDGTLTLNVSGASTYNGMSFTVGGITDLNFLPTNVGFAMSGGQVSGGGADTLLTGQSYSGVVFNNRTTQDIDTLMSSCTFNSCGTMTLTGSLDACAVDNTVINTTTLTKVTNSTLNSDGLGIGIDISAVDISTTQSMSYNNISTGFVDTLGNRTIKVNVTGSAILTIVNDSNDTIFYENIGNSTAGINGDGVVVQTGLVSLTILTQDGNEVRIRQGSFTLQHTQDVTGGFVAYTYSYAIGTKVTISVGASGFDRQTLDYELTDSDASLLFQLAPSNSYI